MNNRKNNYEEHVRKSRSARVNCLGLTDNHKLKAYTLLIILLLLNILTNFLLKH